jgi:hypothetical protein
MRESRLADSDPNPAPQLALFLASAILAPSRYLVFLRSPILELYSNRLGHLIGGSVRSSLRQTIRSMSQFLSLAISFSQLHNALCLGEFGSFISLDQRVIRVHLTSDVPESIANLELFLEQALPGPH